MNRRAPGPLFLLLVITFFAVGCAATISPDGSSGGANTPVREDAQAPEPADSSPGQADRDAASSTLPPAPALDPEPGANICTGYQLDGVAIGMPRSQLEKIAALVPVPSSSALKGYEETTFAFRAVRRGRLDLVQVGLAPGKGEQEPRVALLRARIYVSKTDSWPSSLFAFLGSPKRARVGEWIWWNTDCRATLRLTRVTALGGGESQPYVLDLGRTVNSPDL